MHTTPGRGRSALGLVTIFGTNGRLELSILSRNCDWGRVTCLAVSKRYRGLRLDEAGVSCTQSHKTLTDYYVSFYRYKY